MTTQTANDIVTKALRRANIIAMEEQADGTTYAKALEEYKGFHEYLRAEFPRTAGWTYDAVPTEYWILVSDWYAGWLAEDQSLPSETFEKILAGAARAEARLRGMLSRKPRATVQLPIV